MVVSVCGCFLRPVPCCPVSDVVVAVTIAFDVKCARRCIVGAIWYIAAVDIEAHM